MRHHRAGMVCDGVALVAPLGRKLAAALLVLIGSACASVGSAQESPFEAIRGEPLGVCRLTLEIPAELAQSVDFPELLLPPETGGRALYPAVTKEPLRGVLRTLLNRPQRMTAYFLFRGGDDLHFAYPGQQPYTVRPVEHPTLHAQYLQGWWRQYLGGSRLAGLLASEDPSPPQIEEYLRTMLGARLGLLDRTATERALTQAQLDDPLGLMLGTEQIRTALEQASFLRSSGTPEACDRPLPQEVDWPTTTPPEPMGEVPLEPIAAHVPADCLYVRLGSFANFQWFRGLLTQVGGDLRNLVTVRGVNYGVSAKLERQLVLKTTAASELFGNLVVADVALIGTDAYLREGSSLGVLFEARQSALLSASLNQQRQAVVQENPAVKQEQVEINGQRVSYLSTPDGTVRSYYAVDGNYHLVTGSRKLVERFLTAGQNDSSLADSAEFRLARQRFPLTRGDTLFIFLGTAHLKQLVRPASFVEMRRRLESSGELEWLRLARLAAKAERQPADSIAHLVAGGFLPPGFGQHADGSRIVEEGDQASDSLRGIRGCFAPLADTSVDRITATEEAAWQTWAAYARNNVQRLEPVICGIQRRAAAGKPDQISIALRMSPYAADQTAFLAQWMSGRPDQQQLAPLPGDLVAVELIGQQHLFAGLRDCNPIGYIPGAGTRNVLEFLANTLLGPQPEQLQGYLGSLDGTPLLGPLGAAQFAPADTPGLSQANNGAIWQQRIDRYVVLSLNRDLAMTVAPQLKMVPAARPAQCRLRVGDLRQTQLAELFDTLGGRRAESTTRGNLHLLHDMYAQLHVPPAESLQAVEQLLEARLVCPLGGKYQLLPAAGVLPARWQSTALPGSQATAQSDAAGSAGKGARETAAETSAPPGYRFPVLNWFRGLEADCLLENNTLQMQIELVMDPPGSEGHGSGPAEVVPPPAPQPATPPTVNAPAAGNPPPR